MKRRISFFLVFILAAAVFCMPGCGKEQKTAEGNTENTANPWAEFKEQFTNEKTIYICAFGNRQNEMDMVLEQINKRMTELINTRIELDFIELSDWVTMYPLLLSGGDQVDLVYTSEWCGYSKEAKRGAYYELTDEFIRKYMPYTAMHTVGLAWEQAEVDGKLYAVPRNQRDNASYGAVLARKDIMDELGIDAIESYEEYENFLIRCAENISGGYGFYAFPSVPLLNQIWLPWHRILQLGNGMCWTENSEEIRAEDTEYLYTSDAYREYCLKMAEWAGRGVWPSNAINSTIHTNTQFLEGRSFSMFARIQEAAQYIDGIKAKGYPTYYNCILPKGGYTVKSYFSGDMFAISQFTPDPVRAAVCLDVLKNDKEINLLCQGGIEGRHYQIDEEGYRTGGPKAKDYLWSDWAWALRDVRFYPAERLSEQIMSVSNEMDAHLVSDEQWPFGCFSIDITPVSAEVAVIDSLVNAYEYSFDLGVFGDETEEKYAEFTESLRAAGVDQVIDEYKTQIDRFLKERQ